MPSFNNNLDLNVLSFDFMRKKENSFEVEKTKKIKKKTQ